MYTGSVTNYFTKKPLPHVPVSDGRNVVFTDEEGRFALPGWERAHVVNVGLLTECHDDWYLPVDGREDGYDFTVKPVVTGDNFCFLHMSDSEIEGRSRNDWIDYVRALVKKERPAFYINTGDLCRADGVPRHAYLMNSESVGCPVRYAIGNHDMCAGDYGEQLYERYYGPAWYSFDCGKIHFMVLDIGAGDTASGYPKADREQWIKNDLAQKDEGQAVVMFCHHFHPDPNGYGHTVSAILDLAKDKGLKMLIYGHDHMNYTYEYAGVTGVCSSRPDSGGIDSSPAGSRKIIVRGTALSGDYLYNVPAAGAFPDACDWCTRLENRVGFSSPVEVDGTVWVCTFDDGIPAKGGVYRLDKTTGDVLDFFPIGSIKGDAAYADGRLYALTVSGMLTSIDTRGEKVVWAKTLGAGQTYVYTRSNVLLAGDKVIVSYCGKSRFVTAAFDKTTGEMLWEAEAKGEPTPGRAVYDEARGRLLVGGQWGGFCARSAATGELVWGDPQAFVFNTSTPTVDGDTVIKRSNVQIAVLDAQSGEPLVRTEAPTSFDVSGAAAVDGDTVYVPTVTAGVFAYDKKTLAHLRTFPCGNARLFTAPYFYGNIQTVETTPVIRGDRLIFASSDGCVYIYDKRTAFLMRKITVGAPLIASPVVGDGYLITADFDGCVKKFAL